MATMMSLVMSLVSSITKVGLAPHLLSAWVTSFAMAVVVAAPTAILIAPGAKRLVGYLTATAGGAPAAGDSAPRRDPRAASGRHREGSRTGRRR
jgi:Protein of unknown function (DUF2798)